MDINNKIQNSFNALYNYCREEQYQGWDNFDGLNSRIINNPLFHHSYLLRLAWIQFFKRSPLNFRKVAIVPKGYNPKGLSLFISGLLLAGKNNEAEKLVDLLRGLASPGHEDLCWGYNFDWQARKFLTPKHTPNMVATVFSVNALLDYYDLTGNRDYLEMAESGCRFFLGNLIFFENSESLCFRYMPGSRSIVYNINMLAAAALARVYQKNGDRVLYEKSKKAMTFALRALGRDYSWPYAEKRPFIDSFHTGFNLVSLGQWMECTDEYPWKRELDNAYDYYLRTFWLDNGCPKYYNNSLYPFDIHCSAQGIITLVTLSRYRSNSVHFAKDIAEWAIDNMQDASGYFYYQKTKWYTNRIPYMRWSQAWMFYALSMLVHAAPL